MNEFQKAFRGRYLVHVERIYGVNQHVDFPEEHMDRSVVIHLNNENEGRCYLTLVLGFDHNEVIEGEWGPIKLGIGGDFPIDPLELREEDPLGIISTIYSKVEELSEKSYFKDKSRFAFWIENELAEKP